MAAPAPPAADYKKPATPPPSKAGAEGDKSKAGSSTKPAASDKSGQKAPAPAAGQDKAKGAATPAGADKTGATGSQQRFDRMAVRAKLAVSEPGDAVEREADAIADKVMRMPEPVGPPAQNKGTPPAKPDQIRRKEEPKERGAKPADKTGAKDNKAAQKGAGEYIKRKEEPQRGASPTTKPAAEAKDDKKNPAPQIGNDKTADSSNTAGKDVPSIKREAQTGTSGGASNEPASNAPSTQADLLARLGAGAPLDPEARSFFEQRFGSNLGDIRIHADENAADAARSIQARAFTWGNHIAFASGEYDPGSERGRQLLAHELAHVLQSDSMVIGNVVHRKKDDNPKFKDPNDISKEAIDPGKDKKARPALETLKLPAIKARHADHYKKLAGKSLKRPAGYDRRTPPFTTEQVKKWKEAVDLSSFYQKIGFEPGESGQSLTFYGAKNQSITGTSGEIIEQIKIPKWTPDGSWLKSPLQVDHIIEVQVGGADAFENYELFTGPHNVNVGSLLRAAIYANVKLYLSEIGKNTGDALVRKYLDENDVDFKKVEAGGEGKNLEATSQFWSRQQIAGGKHLIWLQDEKRSKKDEGTDKTRFALYSYTGSGFIDAFPLNKTKVTVTESGRLSGIKIKAIKLNAGFDKVTGGGAVGELTGTWDLPKGVVAKKDSAFSSALNGVAGKPYAGALTSLEPPEVEVEGASPVTFGEVNFVRGKLSAEGTLTTSHELFSGIQIPVRWRGDDFAFEHTFSIDQLKGKLPIPGVTIDDASLTLFFGTKGLGADGSISFTIAGFGAGILSVTIKQGAKEPVLAAKGTLTADRKLFDLATVEIGYSTEKGFFGSGTLGITNPDKIKGIKSAKLTAKYENSVFSATGDVEPNIPGLKSASLTVIYGKDTLEITGKLGIDDKVPGVEKADITVSVVQGDNGWKVGASGEVTPKLPGLSGATLKFSYDDGAVLVEGEFAINKGPLKGTVTAGVTNAEVDPKTGKRSEKGSGNNFKVFGAADIRAEFIKDKLDGTLKLRLLPDGNVRVGGGLAVKDFQVFDKIPSDGGEFLNKTASTPEVPIPGLGFSVGPVSVGLTLSASVTAKAHACIGPGKMTGITLTVEEFDPANIDFNALEIGGGATFQVFADAGFSADAKVNLKLSALVASLSGSIGVEGSVGIPPDIPILTAASTFTYSQAKGLDIMNTLKLDISPALKFRLFGEVKAELELLITSITVWSHDWTLAEANYKLPIGIKATGNLGYNSKTGKLTPENPKDAINIEEPKLDEEAMKSVVMGDPAPPTVKTIDDQGRQLTDEELLMCTPVPSPFLTQAPNQSMMSYAPDQSMMSYAPNQSVMPKREPGAAATPPSAVDNNVILRLGTGIPLDLATRGYFEQHMKADLTRVLIHTGPGAAREADRLSADAFTVSEHIAFAKGKYQPNTPEGQELIAHELAHVAQQQSGGTELIILRWPAVTPTPAQTTETPASIKAKTLSDFVMLTQAQPDWATSPFLQADAASLGQFRDLQTFADGPYIVEACGDLGMGGIIGKGVPGVYPALQKYTEGVTSNATAWLRRTNDINKAERWGKELTTLEGVVLPANLAVVMKKPDPVSTDSPFEKLENPVAPELTPFTTYVTACKPILTAENGSDIDSFLALRREGATPASYLPTVTHVKTYHHFTKATLDSLAENEAVPQWKQNFWLTKRPLTAVLYPAIDPNGAFHRNAGLQSIVTNTSILTIVIEGLATVADYQAQLAPVAARYGADGEIQQAMIGGHGNATILNLAGTATTVDRLGTTGTEGTHTSDLMKELTRLMSSDPKKRRIVLDACLTNSHAVASALRAAPADAAADVNTAIKTNPSLRDFVAGVAGVGANVFGANASFAPAQTTFMTPGTKEVGLSVPGDPDLIASKVQYVEFGTEPLGCMRAVLECWATDQLAGTHDCLDAMKRRIAAGRSTKVPATDTWRESVIHPLYDLVVKHYWGSGDAIRQMSTLADKLFMLFWPHETTAADLNTALAVLTSAAHVDQVLASVSGDPHYAATPRVALVIEQAWMQHTAARHAHFMTALGRYTTCLEASGDMDMILVMPHVPLLLTLPAPVLPPADQLRLALMAAHYAPVGKSPPALPPHIAFLMGLLGAGPTFSAALGISTALGGLTDEGSILADIGRPLLAPAPGPKVKGPPPAANIDTIRDAMAKNEFRVTPMRRNGEVTTVSGDLMVRSTPTTSTDTNIFNTLPKGTNVFVIGEYDKNWYAIEQPGRTGFVAKRYITLLP